MAEMRRWRAWAFLVGLAVATLAGAARANMTFEPLRTDDFVIVVVSGRIDYSDDLGRFEDLVRATGAKVVTFNSPGGNPYKAMELGRLIRRDGLSTLQLRSGDCASACALTFLGGVVRMAEPGSIGVHKSSFSDESGLAVGDAVSSVQALTASQIGYMNDMGVDPSLLQLALQYDADDIRYLSASEMERYRVTTAASPPPEPALSSSPPLERSAPAVRAPVAAVRPSSGLPVAASGRVQHPDGFIELRRRPDAKAAKLMTFANGLSVEILGEDQSWYRIRIGRQVGYAHISWIAVDQFMAVPYGERRIQVRSTGKIDVARSIVLGSRLPLAAYLTSTGWYAITLDEAFRSKASGMARLHGLRDAGAIPSDSLLTFGNTYVRKVCCD